MDKKQVFVLELIDNQKDTWQGTLRWLQGQKEGAFRSALELLRLIASTIGEDNYFDESQELSGGNLWSIEPIEENAG